MIRVRCKCGFYGKVPPALAGKQVKCRQCASTIVVPADQLPPIESPTESTAPADPFASFGVSPGTRRPRSAAHYVLGCLAVAFGVVVVACAGYLMVHKPAPRDPKYSVSPRGKIEGTEWEIVGDSEIKYGIEFSRDGRFHMFSTGNRRYIIANMGDFKGRYVLNDDSYVELYFDNGEKHSVNIFVKGDELTIEADMIMNGTYRRFGQSARPKEDWDDNPKSPPKPPEPKPDLKPQPKPPEPKPQPGPPLDAELAAAIRKQVADKQLKKWGLIGGVFAEDPYEETPPEGAILIGFRYGLKDNRPAVVQPIWQTAAGVVTGKAYGVLPPGAEMLETRAKPGYAVGAIFVRGKAFIATFKPSYMKITDTGLDTNDKYDGPNIGLVKGGGTGTLGGDGNFIVGLHGKLANGALGTLSPVTLTGPVKK